MLLRCCLTHFQPIFHLWINQVVGFTSKMFEKHLWKSDILSKYAGHRQLVFTSKMFEKHLWKSDILSKDAGHRPAMTRSYFKKN